MLTTPHRDRTEGTVRSTRPLVLGGVVVEGLSLRFERGVVVDAFADRGFEIVARELEADDGARRLGELALVDGSSRVGRTGLTFFHTLYDENATCHIAYGQSAGAVDDEAEALAPDEQLARGINQSRLHTDFMVGGPEVAVDGLLADGTEIPLDPRRRLAARRVASAAWRGSGSTSGSPTTATGGCWRGGTACPTGASASSRSRTRGRPPSSSR